MAPVPAASSSPAPAAGAQAHIGASLRAAREKRGLSVAQVSQETKIPRDFIEAAEEDRVADFPPRVYTKSYVNQLCRAYGLDPAPFHEQWRPGGAAAPPPAPATAGGLLVTSDGGETGAKVGYLPRTGAEEKKRVKTISPTMMAVGAVLIALVILAALTIAFHSRRGGGKARAGADGTPPPPAASTVSFEPFMSPQHLPLKELPVPGR
jgi:transcriptional regulator with XRE-family HTH domain